MWETTKTWSLRALASTTNSQSNGWRRPDPLARAATLRWHDQRAPASAPLTTRLRDGSAPSPSPRRSRSTRRPRRSRPRAARHRVRRRRARLPDARLHRRRRGRGLPRPARTTATPRPAGCPSSRRRSPPRPLRDSGLEVEPAQVLVTNGGKQAIYAAFAAMLDPGDEVIVPAPYWTTYPEAIQLAGGVAGRGARRRDPGLQGHRRAARGRAHRAHQGAAVRLAVQPDRRGLHRRRDPRDRRGGSRTTTCGC